jgi:hypothetical protein
MLVDIGASFFRGHAGQSILLLVAGGYDGDWKYSQNESVN